MQVCCLQYKCYGPKTFVLAASDRMSRTVFVGNLPLDIRNREVEDLFGKYGRIADIDLKLPTRPPGFAFIEFEDARDAQDSVKGRDGYDFAGARLRVGCSHAKISSC